ncbi:hypothetical protein CYLTODRAFT_372907 [Cylindrobasidium torrendii FP15055 ss-10]|uniref:HRDC domain-containing protein n=1 Tax=Cylindrobasidium torrendii FP15055 ss-10 TaxID=1314674 RepID=A0A0D7BGJ3_9AGAR|nr:hypothetical protein CYLTODRAFT_372907 [Cylindrobasidium torrendii FP15055 ss-10]
MDFEQLNTKVPAAALKATRTAALLPVDILFHKSMDAAFAQDLDEFSSKVLSLTNRLLDLSSTIDSSGKSKGGLREEEDVLDRFDSCVVDRVDQLLERVDTALDEYTGRSKVPAIAVQVAPKQTKTTGRSNQRDFVVQHAAHLEKPQLRFKETVDNSNSIWHPRLKHKYNAKVPLGHSYVEEGVTASQLLYVPTHALMDLWLILYRAPHPYRYEIKHLAFPPRMTQISPPIPPKPFDTTTFTWVDNSQALQAMLAKLRQALEIAVDLEHHSYRTYNGFLCLMQISTREEDWIVDLLELRDEAEILNEVFTDPSVIKVFHGAESDIVWLQQDLNIYVVNMFDTYHASKALAFPRHGLANLLEMYCDFTPDKRYQLADWRVRPLSEPMLNYARSDTHFLLYIYDNLRNALLDRGEALVRSHEGPNPPSSDTVVREVLANSQETALKVYVKDNYDEADGSGGSGWDTLARKWNKMSLVPLIPVDGPDAIPAYVYKAVHSWRDRVAREEDESTRYVLPNHLVFQLAETPPPDLPALLRIFHSPPPVIKRRAKELLEVIREAVKSAFSPPSAAMEVVEVQPKANELQDKPDAPPQAAATPSLWGSTSSQVPSKLFELSSSSGALATSSLFGPHKPLTPKSAALPVSSIMNRIHDSLSIAPTLPQVIVAEKDNDASMQEDIALGMQVEVPFVPAAQRAHKEEVEDTIVVVGQGKQKKRKREDGPSSSVKVRRPSPSSNDEAPNEPFDFSSAVNVLDAVPEAKPRPEKKTNKKDKKDKKGGSSAPRGPAPKAHNAPKSGNKSATFRKR